MKEKDSRIYLSSVNSISARLENYGDADISKVSLLKLIYKYAEYSTEYATLKRLDSMVAELQRTSPFICLEKFAVQAYIDTSITIPIVDIGGGTTNQPPVMTDIAATLGDTVYTYAFSSAVLYSTYTDDAGGSPSSFVIKSIPAAGLLKYNGTAVTIGAQYTNPALLTFTRDGVGSYADVFTFSVYDNDSQIPLESNTVNSVLTITAIAGANQAPTVGDRAQYAGNRTTTVFTVADFTTETILPYFDPETNDLDAIRIDEVSTANVGTYYFLGTEVVEGQIITNAELVSGAFYHVAADANAIATDSFNASIRDTGSMIWVQ